jgi:AcrR family transcriptional regulator
MFGWEIDVAETRTRIADHEALETKERILSAAEKLFAERGYDATSVRDITSEAECNVAAVNYHFGGKENLYVETFRGLLGELRDRRIQRIRTDMEAAGDAATLELFLEFMANAFLEPLVEEDRGRLLLAFVWREMLDRHVPLEVFLGEFVRPLMQGALEHLGRVGPPLEPMTARLCVLSLIGQLLFTLKARHVFLEGASTQFVPETLNEHISHILRFSAAGIRASARERNGDAVRLTAGSPDHAQQE